MPVILGFGGAGTPGASTSITGATSTSSPGPSQLALAKERNLTPIPKEPIRNPIFDGDGTDQGRDITAHLGNINRTWVYYWQKRFQGGGGAGPGGGFEWRTLLLKDTTVGSNIADAVVVTTIPQGGVASCQEVIGVLRKTISADLTVRLNIYVAGVKKLVGSFTIPKATAIFTAIRFQPNAMTTTAFPDLGVLVWDVVASGGEKDNGGVASFTVVYQ